MTLYYSEPQTAEEVIARARAVLARRSPRLSMPEPNHRAGVQVRSLAVKSFAYEKLKKEQIEAAKRERSRLRLAEWSAPGRAKSILKKVSEETGVSVDDILGISRYKPVIDARFDAIHRIYKSTGWSLKKIGVLFNRDHTTILSALRNMGIPKVKKIKSCPPLEAVSELYLHNPATGVFYWNRSGNNIKRGDKIKRKFNRGIRMWLPVPPFGSFQAQQLAWLLYYGVDPGVQVVPINGDRSDTRISNLRLSDEASA